MWLAGCLLLAAVARVCAHGDPPRPAEDDRGTPIPPEHGSLKTIPLGSGETMIFVWIGPLEMWVGRFEVTNAQYRRYDPEHDSGEFEGYYLDDRNQPAVRVSWEEARNFCLWLNRHFGDRLQAGYSFRLPDEEEWEMFASCGDNRKFPWGDRWPPPRDRNYRGEEGVRGIFRLFGARNFIRGHRGDHIVSAPVHLSGSNEWSLYGAGGNVWEWCRNWFDEEQDLRAVRGASWSNFRMEDIVLTNRVGAPPRGKTAMIGFRVVIGK